MTTPTETAVRALLGELIDAATGLRLPADANFFEAGLTSEMLVRVHAALEGRLGREVPLTDLFKYPNRRALSRRLAAPPGPAAPPVAGPTVTTTGTAGGPGAHDRRAMRSHIRARTQLRGRDGGHT